MKVVFSTFRLLFFLWPVSSGCPSKADIPKCSYCAGPLCFEFQVLDHECDLDNFLLWLKPNSKLQIMPQLLFYFNVKNDVDSLDWATISVYTCEASCDATQVWLTKKNSLGFNFLSHLVPCQILCTPRLGDIAVQVLLLNQELRKSER
ncbi:unnamed protein product [Prunus armeniaca]|uniref:Programmed cell death protein 2 C-terminal domain-containing protein n=1 Tax=Prunus armeniaca TaxID=36596 RepID=A0A6J5UMG0_PRUAR|nr:unnamed protein product [Prunus armeniaca]